MSLLNEKMVMVISVTDQGEEKEEARKEDKEEGKEEGKGGEEEKT